MSDTKEVTRFTSIFFKHAKELFKHPRETHFKFNICFDGVILILILADYFSSGISELINQAACVIKSIHLNTNIEYNDPPSHSLIFFAELLAIILCFIICVWYDYYKEKRMISVNKKRDGDAIM